MQAIFINPAELLMMFLLPVAGVVIGGSILFLLPILKLGLFSN